MNNIIENMSLYEEYLSDDEYESNDESKEEMKYVCKICKYSTKRESQYERHVKTNKHLNKKEEQQYNEDKIFQCKCGKRYKYASGLSKHRRFCINEKEDEDKIKLKDELIMELKGKNDLLTENIMLREEIKNMKVTNITNNSNNINNTFNMNFFLNETCKDAMNIFEFIESIEVTIDDLKYLGKNGYVEGISKLLIENLKQLDITKRPLHCSDLKREIIHIKDKNVWEKENKNKEKLRKVLLEISRTNTIALEKKYKEQFPQCMTDYKSKEHKEYGEIVHQAFGGNAKDLDFQNNKVIRRFLKIIEIPKKRI